MVVTLRNVKGSALTHSELDANFTTLQNADIDSAAITSIAQAVNLNTLAGDSDIDFGSKKILYSNNYDSLGALPSAATYHGMFAHVHGEAKAYYAHGGAWIKLADYDDVGTGIDSAKTISLIDSNYVSARIGSIGGHTDVNISGVSNNQILKWDSAQQLFVAASGSGGGNPFDQDLNTTDSAVFAGLTVNGPFDTTTAGTPTITANSNLVLKAGGSVTVSQDDSNNGGGFRVATLTSTQRNALSAANGEIVYNSSTNKLQTYENNAWEDVISSSSTPGATFTMTANGSSDYVFAADSRFFPTSANDPVLYLRRGDTYTFVNNSGGSHPFQIRVSNGGSAYSTGVTNNGASSGNIVFTVPMSAPATLYYQCTAHSGMGNTINIV